MSINLFLRTLFATFWPQWVVHTWTTVSGITVLWDCIVPCIAVRCCPSIFLVLSRNERRHQTLCNWPALTIDIWSFSWELCLRNYGIRNYSRSQNLATITPPWCGIWGRRLLQSRRLEGNLFAIHGPSMLLLDPCINGEWMCLAAAYGCEKCENEWKWCECSRTIDMCMCPYIVHRYSRINNHFQSIHDVRIGHM